jgi:hypothetical protein
MKWVESLILDNALSVEYRVKMILEYIFSTGGHFRCVIKNIDATGLTGNKFTKILNLENHTIFITELELMRMFSEDGQIFELDLLIDGSRNFRIIVRDGNSVDILGDTEKPSENILGKSFENNINYF